MLIEEFSVREVITSGAAGSELGWRIFCEALEENNIPHRTPTAGESFSFGDATCEVVWHTPDAENENDTTLVLRVVYGDTAFLFMGDMEKEGEAAMLATLTAEDLRCDVLKVGHHGSRTSTTDALLAVCAPRYAAISCGAGNDYGFPHAEVTERLAACGAAVHRTDTDGTLYYHSDGTSVTYGKP
jgi:beta-lactamase superfamily II metal-dependent hydrolase